MTRAKEERLAALIDDPGAPRPLDDPELARLVGIAEQLSALQLAAAPGRAFTTGTRLLLIAAAAQELQGPVETSGSPSRLRWWFAGIVAVLLLTITGASFAGDVEVNGPHTPRTYGPVAPADAPASAEVQGGGAGSTSRPVPTASGGAVRAATPATPAESPPPPPPPSPDNHLVCVKVLDLQVCL